MTTKLNCNTKLLKKLSTISGKELTLGNLLLFIRKGEDLSQVEFAEKLGVSKQYLCDLERGRRFVSPKVAGNYARKLGYSETQFIRLCLQDLVNRDGIYLYVSVDAA